MSSHREEAEYLRVAIAMGLLDTAEAVAWADRTMMELDTLPIELIDVSLAGKLPAEEMMKFLALVPGPGDLTAGAHRALGILRDRLETGIVPLEPAVEMLERYQRWATAPEDESDKPLYFRYMLGYAQDGSWAPTPGASGSPLDMLRDELIEYLKRTTSR